MALNYRIHLDDAEAPHRRCLREANPWRGILGAHRDGESFLMGRRQRAWEIPGQITTAGRIGFAYREDYPAGPFSWRCRREGCLLTRDRVARCRHLTGAASRPAKNATN